jgi:hypothetical protein
VHLCFPWTHWLILYFYFYSKRINCSVELLTLWLTCKCSPSMKKLLVSRFQPSTMQLVIEWQNKLNYGFCCTALCLIHVLKLTTFGWYLWCILSLRNKFSTCMYMFYPYNKRMHQVPMFTRIWLKYKTSHVSFWSNTVYDHASRIWQE